MLTDRLLFLLFVPSTVSMDIIVILKIHFITAMLKLNKADKRPLAPFFLAFKPPSYKILLVYMVVSQSSFCIEHDPMQTPDFMNVNTCSMNTSKILSR